MMKHTGSQVDSRGRYEGEGKYCVYEGMVCLLDGTDVCAALAHILLPNVPLLHSDLVLRQRYHPPTIHQLSTTRTCTDR